MDFGIAGRRALVAAASGGLGFACAAALIGEGVEVAICGSDRSRISDAAKRLGGNTLPLVAQLTEPDSCERLIHEAIAALGGLDILVINGPGPTTGTFSSTTHEQFQGALDVALLSVVRMCYAALPELRKQHWGRVVAITSIAVRQPIPNLILSNTARAGATGFLKTLAGEVAADGVTVNSVQPGLHDTDRVRAVYGFGLPSAIEAIPARTLGAASDLGSLVGFLCSEQAGYITGVAIPIDGGVHAGLQ